MSEREAGPKSRFPNWSARYPKVVLEERAWVAENGSFREKVRFDLVERPHYAFGMLAAADMASYCGITRLTAIEFGVADGAGLLNLCRLAEQIEAETGIAFELIGFDTGIGLPRPVDYRDHPEVWSDGDFAAISEFPN